MTEQAETRATVPNPGSDAAVSQGCICAVLDNGHGRGNWVSVEGKPEFWITEGCPLHAPRSKTPRSKKPK